MPLLMIGLLLLCASAAQANPLASAPGQFAAAPDSAAYQGRFANENLSLSLTSQGGDAYSGEIVHGGQTYSLQARAQGGLLSGAFQSGSSSFTFSASLQGNHALLLESGGARYVLQKEAAPNPLAPPGQAASPWPAAAPARPPAPPFVPGLPPMPPVPPLLQAVLSDDPGALLSEYAALSGQVQSELQYFLDSLKQWMSGDLSDEQAAALLQQQLLPATLSLNGKLERLGGVAGQISKVATLEQKENEVFQKLASAGKTGAEYFSSWHGLLGQMLELNNRGDHQALQALAGERLPVAVRNTMTLAKGLTALLRLGNAVKGVETAKVPSAASLNPSKLLKLETLRNMSEMMRDGMNILRNMQQK